MKINKIRLNNINCLRGEFNVDFTKEPFVSAGLFAITGQTGAGKSTLLDAVTLALFNRVPRFDKAVSKDTLEKTGLILTRNEKECYVEVEYSCAKGNYCSKWSVSKTRNNTFREYEMELVDLSTGNIIEEKKKQVPEKNEELIGLNYDQFLRSILLSQGGFAKFLESKKDDRSKLLEDITGLDLYSRLGSKAYQIWDEKNKTIKAQKDVLKHENDQLIAEDILQELQNSEVQLTERKAEHEKEEKRYSNLIDIKKRMAQFKLELSGHLAKKEAIEKSESDFIANKLDKLQRHQQLIPFQERIHAFTSALQQITRLDEAINESTAKLAAEVEEQKRTISQVEILIGKPCTQEDVVSNMNTFREEVSALLQLANQKETSCRQQLKRAENYLTKPQLANLRGDLQRVDALSQKVSDLLTELTSKTTELSEQGITADTVQQKIQDLRKQQIHLTTLKGEVGSYTTITSQIEEAEKKILEAENSRPEIDLRSIQSEMQSLETSINAYRDQMAKKILESSANIKALRQRLTENEPCPVCGSLDHPYAEEYMDVLAELQAQVNNSEQKLKEKQQLHEETSKKLASIETTVKQSTDFKESAQAQLNGIMERIDVLKNNCGIQEVKTPTVVEEALLKCQRQIDILQQADADFNQVVILRELQSELATLIQLKGEWAVTKENLQKVYTGNNISADCDGFINIISSIRASIIGHNKLIFQLKEDLKGQESVRDHIVIEIKPSLNDSGYDSPEQASEYILPATEADELRNEEDRIKSEKKSLAALIQQTTGYLEQAAAEDDPQVTENTCQELRDLYVEKVKDVENEIRAVAVKLEGNAERLKKIAAIENEIGEVQKQNLKWDLLKDLIGDKEGKKFSTFAQSLTLKKLVALANKHLGQLNDRYKLDVPNENEEDDLSVADTYQGDERRSVKTLSGGEKFLVSLSLALALSDLASRNVRIESLFIDEGFGTLDPETLDQAVTTLEQLQSESNKMIGVISHVETMKERITTQIQMEKGNAGFSKMKFVPEVLQ